MRMGPDLLGFIGGSKAADAILREHPAPHRLRTFLSLDGKNLGIVTADADLNIAARECCVGALSFNGQRCTAIKMIMVHESIAPHFLQKLLEEISVLKAGLPWEEGVYITPLPQVDKIDFLTGLVDDAISKGAEVINKLDGGGFICGNLMRPAVVYPITDSMRLWHEEQMGPIIPVAIYDDIEVVKNYISRSSYGLQSSIFSENAGTTASLIDVLSTAVGRININTQVRNHCNFNLFCNNSSWLSIFPSEYSVVDLLTLFRLPVDDLPGWGLYQSQRQ
jgi:glyceraldehyde-3-phosphate dehydrogenase (NADP+)